MRTNRLMAAVVGVVVSATALAGCSVASGYVKEGERVISAQNLRTQYKYITRDWNSLITTADTACAAQAEGEKDDADPTLVEGPALAYASTYRTVWAKYNARMADVFEAGFVGPPGYPKHIPNFDEVTGPNPDFCAVSTHLLELKAEAE
jgi:hypothetical protein